MDDISLVREINQAIKNSDYTELARLFTSAPSQINATSVFGNWLHFAISFHANIEVVKYLVKKGIDINQKAGILGGTPLNLAASEGRIDIVNYLLQSGSEIDISEPERNPLFSAIYGGHKDIVDTFLAHGIDFRIKYSGNNMNNMSALEFAKERGQLEIVETLSLLSD